MILGAVSQVFLQSGYQELFDGLKRTTAAGGPTHHLANYTVLTNSHQGVWGGWQVGSRSFIACSAMLPLVLLDSH
jgi:hypothetical protein